MVFFSWSKEDSRQYAFLTKQFFSKIFDLDNLIWFSDNSIESGKGFFEEIITGANKCNAVVLFLTKENLYNPWLQFELGVFFGKDDCKIWPICFDGALGNNTTVFAHIQVQQAEKEVFLLLVEQIYNLNADKIEAPLSEITERFEKFWPDYVGKIDGVKNTFSQTAHMNIHDLIFRLNDECHLFGKEGTVFRLDKGFETHDLYHFILENTHQRLWVFGRKNKKLFDRGNIECFRRIRDNNKTSTVSIKCLFLDPASNDAILAHAQNKRNFKASLEVCIDDAIEVLRESGFDAKNTIKLYRLIRNDAIIISDNMVYFENVKYSEEMVPFHLTDSGFFVASTDSCVGKYFLEIFQDVWEQSFQIEGDQP